MKYTPKKVEKKWQTYWEKNGTFKDYSRKEKFYSLDMFPYPSGEGLHVGHPKGYIATDVSARFQQLRGKSVLHPMGWDAFGLPAENYAIKNKVHPSVAVAKNIKRFKEQLQMVGCTYDWDREIATTDPNYYRWTQWIFLKMFEHGLAYESYEPINWCPSCKTGLANEDLEDGKCERCGSEIEQKPMRQWVLKMTEYADRLLSDLDTEDLDWEKSIVDQQKNWIGRSEGAVVKFPISNFQFPTKGQNKNDQSFIEVFTTRVDTIFSAAFLVVAPENKWIMENKEWITNFVEVENYVEQAKKKTTLQRTDLAKEKTGVELRGIKAINPANGEELPIWVADFVLGSYGTGAVFGDAHDERDFEFAEKYSIPLRQSIVPFFSDTTGKDAVRSDVETVRRKTAFALVKHWSEEKYLCLDWEKFGWHSGIIGGIEEGESAQEAAMREIIEETGYKNPEFVRLLGGEIYTNFYAAHKGVNRYAEGVGMLFQLKDDAWEAPKEEEIKNHKAVWIEGNEMEKFLNLKNFQYMWEVFSGKRSECFTEDGVLIDSGEFTGLTSKEARKKITEWLEKTGNGKRQVHFKMRDWVFSRQRYWGEPIPIVHCEACADCKTEVRLELNFRDESVWEAIMSGKKTIETRALNPEESDRYFGDVRKGDALRLVNKNSDEKKVYTVTEVFSFANVQELFEQKEILREILSGEMPNTLEELEKQYASLSPEYLEKIERNGLVAWRIKKASQAIGVPEEDLPVVLPNVVSYEPTGTGESPLAGISEWVNTTCPKCSGPAKRETNTMPQWAGSSWYYLAYIMKGDANFQLPTSKFFSEWLPVDLYVGGAEQATRHLLYARFWHKFLYDIQVVPTKEPFRKLVHVGLIGAADGRKMSKRWNNVINPDDVIAEFGADSLRLYEMFMGPFTQAIAWNTEGVSGVRRFLEKVWKLQEKLTTNDQQSTTGDGIENLLHKTIKKVTEDIENFRFNTAVSSLMILVNAMEKQNFLLTTHYSLLTTLLSPFAPHIAEELWEKMGHTTSIFLETWPEWDEKLIADETITMVVQVNGKVRDQFSVPADISEEEAKKLALESGKVQKFLSGKPVRKVIFVKGKLINIVV